MRESNVRVMVGALVAVMAVVGVSEGANWSLGLGLSNRGGGLSIGVNSGGYVGGGAYYSGGARHHRRHIAPRHHRPMVHVAPVVVAPPPVVYAPPVVTVVQPGGYWVEREQTVEVGGYWRDTIEPSGRRIRTWVPGHTEVRRVREWVAN